MSLPEEQRRGMKHRRIQNKQMAKWGATGAVGGTTAVAAGGVICYGAAAVKAMSLAAVCPPLAIGCAAGFACGALVCFIKQRLSQVKANDIDRMECARRKYCS